MVANGLDALSVVSPCCFASCSSFNTLLLLFCYPTRVDPRKPHPNRLLDKWLQNPFRTVETPWLLVTPTKLTMVFKCEMDFVQRGRPLDSEGKVLLPLGCGVLAPGVILTILDMRYTASADFNLTARKPEIRLDLQILTDVQNLK